MGSGLCTTTMPFLRLLSLLLLVVSTARQAQGWCTVAYGGIGEYSKKCPSSVEFEACHAMCQCYDGYDNPTHTHCALCLFNECHCVLDSCPYGRLKTDPICCTKSDSGMNCDNFCDDHPGDCSAEAANCP